MRCSQVHVQVPPFAPQDCKHFGQTSSQTLSVSLLYFRPGVPTVCSPCNRHADLSARFAALEREYGNYVPLRAASLGTVGRLAGPQKDLFPLPKPPYSRCYFYPSWLLAFPSPFSVYMFRPASLTHSLQISLNFSGDERLRASQAAFFMIFQRRPSRTSLHSL